ncbi:hypothetical protein NDU88_001829 [Pleurodeles waltl]|uniref:Uncharacterized protein n=1 Tax=Pleurodeles waltl TaxID=8319 RepID=A0AAV7KQG6_PLEWA|nr:hypothetical protein NDU88_001829 [Pleurodeles waltl]
MLCFRGGDDDLPSSQGNGDAGNQLGNPDIRVPESTEREDGLGVRGEEEEGKDADHETEKRKETEDGRRNGHNEGPLKITGQPWERRELKRAHSATSQEGRG